MPTDNHYDIMERIKSELNNSALVFPTCFDLSLKIQRLIDDPESSIFDVANTIQTEPVLTSKLYQVANSAALNPSNVPVKTVARIVQRTGLDLVRYLSMIIIREQVMRDLRSSEVKSLASALWRHTVEVMAWSYAIAEDTNIVRPDEIMFSYVISTIGEFYILHKAQKYPELMDNNDVLTKLMNMYGTEIANSILSSYGINKNVGKIRDPKLFEREFWPIKNVQDIVHFANVLSDFENPLHEPVLSLQEYFEKFSVSEEIQEEIRLFIANIQDIRDLLFTAATM